MSEQKAPAPKTRDELIAYIDSLTSGPMASGYEGSAQALHLAAEAAFNYVASELGVTGFQAGWASLRFYANVMGIKGPFGVLRAEDYLYPQYGLPSSRSMEWYEDWKPWLKEQAQKKLDDGDEACAEVMFHWKKLANAPTKETR